MWSAIVYVLLGLYGLMEILLAFRSTGYTARGLVRVQILALVASLGVFVVAAATPWGTGPPFGLIFVVAVLGIAMPFGRYCPSCGHNETWSRLLESPRTCSYDQAELVRFSTLAFGDAKQLRDTTTSDTLL